MTTRRDADEQGLPPLWPFMQRPGAKWGAALLGFLAVYVTLSQAGLASTPERALVAPAWPASGLALVIMIWFGTPALPMLILADLLSGIVHDPLGYEDVISAVGNGVAAWLGAWALLRFKEPGPLLDRSRTVMVFLITALVPNASLAAAAGTLGLYLEGVIGLSLVLPVFETWFLSDAVGVLVVAPLLLMAMEPARRLSPAAVAEVAVAAVLFSLVSYAVFWRDVAMGDVQYPVAFVLFPFLLWIALRLRGWSVPLAVLIVTVASLGGTMAGTGPFAHADIRAALLIQQVYLAVLAASAFVLHGVVRERAEVFRSLRKSEKALLDLNQSLEARVTERTRDLVESEQRIRSLTDNLPVVVHQCRIVEGRVAAFEFVSDGVSRLLGLDPDELVRDPSALFRRAASLDDANRLREITDALAHGRHPGDSVVAMQAADGSQRWIQCLGRVRVTEDGRSMLDGVFMDVTESRGLQEELERLATTDSLTGLANRRRFLERGEAAFLRSRRYDRPLAVLMVDADHFKAVNDTHGHDVGDKVLRVLADTLRATVRDTDVVGRLGGEEFAVVLTETGGEAAIIAAERVRASVENLAVDVGGEAPLRFTVSLGLVRLDASVESFPAMLRLADQALYMAKAQGRNRVVNDLDLAQEVSSESA